MSDILFPQLVHWDNLLTAYRSAARGKRGRDAAAAFEFKLADNLLLLQSELDSGSYQPQAYTHFYIHEPKRRKISAAPFRDRVVHHALCNVIEPLFERQFHHHSYANRIGKGTHLAIDQLQAYTRQFRYVLRMDIVQHFASIDHAILKQVLFDTVLDEEVRQLMTQILASGEGVLSDEYHPAYFAGDTLLSLSRPRGLPIGNLTSQFWSNCFLNGLDWFVTRTLGCRAYVRYVDDFALFSNSKRDLWAYKAATEAFLSQLRLKIHTQRAQPSQTKDGVPWLGFVVYPTHRRVKRRNVVHFRRKLHRSLAAYKSGKLSFAELDAQVQGWINHVRYADTWNLRTSLLDFPV